MYIPKHLLSLIFLAISFNTSGQIYVFDIKDTSSYHITCGKVTSAYWGTSNDSCTLTTATLDSLALSCADSGRPIFIPFSLKINQTGNLGCEDTAWVEYMVDSVWTTIDTIIGCEQTPNIPYYYNPVGYAGCSFAVRVTFQTSSDSAKWQLRDGELIIQNPCILLPIQTFTIDGQSTFAGNELTVTLESPYNTGPVTIEKKVGDQFELLGQARLRRDESGVRKYQFVDTKEDPVSYYRAVVTSEATATYTGIIKVVSAKMSKLNIHPNPAREWLSVRMPGGLVPGMQFHLVDAAGKIVQSWEQVEKEQESIQLNVDNLPGGLYMLVMEGGVSVTSAMVSIRY